MVDRGKINPDFYSIDINIPIPEVQTFSGKNETKVFTTTVQTCRQCKGTGHLDDEYNNDPCPMCSGSGEIYARITVEWLPNIPVKHNHSK